MHKTNAFSARFFTMIAAGLVVSALLGCSNVASASSSSSSDGNSSAQTTSTTSATKTQTATYSSSSNPNVIKLDYTTKTLTISGVPTGAEIYLAKTNPTSTKVASTYSRYITSASGISLNKATSTSSPSTPSSSSSSGGTSHPNWQCYLPPELSLSEGSARAATATTATQIDGIVGDTMSIYIDTESTLSTAYYTAKDATLRAVGTYCYVWVIDDYYSTTASGAKVDTTVAENVATQFDAVYPMVRNVFGEESDVLLYYGSSTTYPMSSYSTTGTKVNIVLYDIAADYSSESTSSTGIAGYFYSKDYYYSGSNISNKGKYFYVDSAYANEDINDIYSTLAHEFQHMIHFGVKYIEQGISSGTGYNEMLSMLCEDMMEAYFEGALDGFDEEASPMNRLPWFNALYYYSGLEYREDSTAYALCSYATNYAFGAWLLRNYGGIPLLAKMSANAYKDTASIVAAVNSINSTSLTMTDLLLAFAQACLFEEADSGFNISVDALTSSSSSYYSSDSTTYGYPLEAIDLWDLETLLPSTAATYTNSSYYKYDGPDLLHSNEYIEVRPYGILLHDLGTTTASTVTLTLSTSSSSSLKTYVYIYSD